MRRTARSRWIAGALAGVLFAGYLSGADGPAAALAAGGPSVGLTPVPSVPVQSEGREAAPPDQTSGRELRGDQPAGGAAKDGGGTPTATSLSASATWNVSPRSGDFSWSYPFRVPPAPGGLEPDLTLSYSSSAVDGRTSATNNQASWVGDGWDLSTGFVERSYGGCADDKEGSNPGQQVGDLCWRSDNATASYGGGGGMLIRDGATGVWRPKNDDGARIERDTGAGNGDDNGEYWKITTVDGTQYFYGSRPDAKSTWTVPVYGDDSAEPCHRGAFETNSCTQAWRWNLDKVIDARGNMMLLDYEPETNSYGMNLKDAAVSYIRGGTLKEIRYGLHTGVAAQASGRMLFTIADRCVPGSACTFANKDNWPDTALSEHCDTPTCPDKHAPTFWSSKRLSSVTTQVLRDGSYADVDRWTLDQSFPIPGDGEKAALWLKSIVHTGLAGGSETLPPVTFAGRQLANRVFQTDNLSPIIRYRISSITSESGGVISINYAEPDCTAPPANPESNTKRCFPVRWAKPNHAERTDYFHRYVVESVVSSDQISSSIDSRVSYEYLDGAAWHYDTSEFTPNDKRTWNEFRGFTRVRIRTGRTDDPGGSPISMTEQRFFRGMHGDTLPNNGSRNISVADSEGGSQVDHDWLSGFGYESTTFLGESSTVVSRTLTTPVWQGPTATRGSFKAYLVNAGVTRTFTTLDAGRPRRETKSETTYDDRGLPTVLNDLGDVALTTDDLCTRTTYVRNTDTWLLSKPSRVQTVSVHCGAAPTFPDHAVSDQLTSYDNHVHGSPPTAGKPTKTEILERHPASGPPVYTTTSTAKFDTHGREVERTDPLDRKVRTAYTPATGGPAVKLTITDPMDFTVTSVIDPAFGLPSTVTDVNGRVTETTYDALGRSTQVWGPDRPRADFGTTPHYKFSYRVSRDEPNAVTTTKLGPNENYLSSTTLYDGLLRQRQTQTPAVGGGRLIVDTRYDSHGRAYKTTQPYFNDAAVDSNLWRASDTQVPGLAVSQFDGAGRETAARYLGGATEQWRTSTAYGGDRVHVTPPPGGVASTTVQDARGRSTEVHQYRAPTPTGAAQVTRYGYWPSGEVKTVRDPLGNTWTNTFDLRGRLVHVDDPDKGDGLSTYDAAGQLETQTDARGITVAYAYDRLGRRVSTRLGGPMGRLLARWTYDTAEGGLGQRATATSYDADGNAYTSSVDSYSARYQALRTSVTIPESEGALAGTYVFRSGYKADGVTLAGQEFPEIGGLFGEEVFHTYNDFGLPETTYGGPEGSTVTYVSDTDYTRYGEVQRIQLGTGTKRAWQSFYYDDATRRIERTIVDAEVPNPMQADINYQYDPAGNVLSIANTPIGKTADTQCFRYDHLRRLTEAWTPGNGCATAPTTGALSGPAPYWQSFGYDAIGNRLSRTQHTSSGNLTQTYSYPRSGKGAVGPHALGSVRTSTPAGLAAQTTNTHDATGNMLTRGAQQLTWDEQGHLATLTENGRTTSHLYDTAGQRLLRREPTSTVMYVGGQEIRLDRSTGTVTGTRYYQHGGETVSVRTPGGRSWLTSDHHGTAEVAIDTASLSTKIRRQDPFGNARGPQPSGWPSERGFVGGVGDPSGLTHIGAREYDPNTGRFISVDPVLAASDPQQLHAYAYANNSPVTFSDPTGLYCDSCEFYDHQDGPEHTSVWSNWSPGSGGSTLEGERSAGHHAKEQAKKNMKQPVKVNGKRVSESDITNIRKYWGYHGSNDFTYEDALEFAAQGGGQAAKTCFLMGGSDDVCAPPPANPLTFGDILGFIYDLTPISDVHHCVDGSESCWWILSNLPGGKFVKFADEAADAAKTAAKGCSFTGETLVLMADGSRKPIAEVEVGDQVVASDPETGERQARKVDAVFRHADQVIDLAVDGEIVTTTPDHPFWNETDRAFQTAADLTRGDHVLGADGRRHRVRGLHLGTVRTATAYNLSIDGLHTYHVGRGDLLVHNVCLPELRDWSSQHYQFGNAQFLLDRGDMTHLLTRHHPKYWDGSTKETQTFYDASMSIQDVQDSVSSVMRQNRDRLIEIGAGTGQVNGTVNGVNYVLGVRNGHVGQFFPLPR